MPTGIEEYAAYAMIASAIKSMFGGGEEEMPTQHQQLGFMPQQAPQTEPFMPSGLPQQPNYQTPPAVTQFPPFQPLFPRQQQRRLGQ